MQRASSISGLVVAVAATLCVAAPAAHAGGAFVPPTKLDVGKIALNDRHGNYATGTTLMVGLNWATIYPKRTNIDVGIGYIGTFMPEPDLYKPIGAVPRAVVSEPVDLFPAAHGAYVDVSMLAHQRSHMRSWVTGRVEVLGTGDTTVWGLATRYAAELWSGVKIAGRGGGGFGVFALGLWVEGGVRGLPDGRSARHVSAGLSGRVPLFAAGH